eukprot:s522_g22.t1
MVRPSCVACTAQSNLVAAQEKYCMNQGSALQLGTMSLTQCMAECDSRSGCTSIQYDCGTDCWLMVADVCGTELQTSCGSSVYYKQAGAVSTTGADVLGGCFPSTFDTGSYTCTAEALKAKIGTVFLLKGVQVLLFVVDL